MNHLAVESFLTCYLGFPFPFAVTFFCSCNASAQFGHDGTLREQKVSDWDCSEIADFVTEQSRFVSVSGGLVPKSERKNFLPEIGR
jgi:hypothetical protein